MSLLVKLTDSKKRPASACVESLSELLSCVTRVRQQKRELTKRKQAQHADVDAENTNLRRKSSERRQCRQCQ